MSDKSRRVFLTRSAEGCARWRPQLEALGHEVLSLPVIRFATLPAGGVELSNYNWVILTSPQGAKAYSAVFGGEVSAIKPSIATMAKATRTVLEASGQRDALGIEAGGGKELADALCQRLPAASRLLLPGAERGAPMASLPSGETVTLKKRLSGSGTSRTERPHGASAPARFS